ncbi:MAG: hypothetical protein H8E46_12705 [FCB group bacterium]|nr:hypothetical protein [FCB group bacterium]
MCLPVTFCLPETPSRKGVACNAPTIKHILILLILACITLTLSSSAYWPTTVEENLPVSVTLGLYEGYPDALPYPDGGTLVTWWRADIFNCYQIIDRYGEFVFDEPQLLSPAVSDPYIYPPSLLPDGFGGAFAAGRKRDHFRVRQ